MLIRFQYLGATNQPGFDASPKTGVAPMQRTGRSPLFSALRRAYRAARLENHRLTGCRRARMDRRRFLAAGTGVLATHTTSGKAARHQARIAVVGAGIAGLNATYLLANAGLPATLYEG